MAVGAVLLEKNGFETERFGSPFGTSSQARAQSYHAEIGRFIRDQTSCAPCHPFSRNSNTWISGVRIFLSTHVGYRNAIP
jgi:hypothetical protein